MKKITVIGTGYVGLVNGAGISDFGHNVICVDIDHEKISALQDGEIPIFEPGLKELVKRNRVSGRLSFSTNIGKAIRAADVILIAVGTPQGENGRADISAVENVAKFIGNVKMNILEINFLDDGIIKENSFRKKVNTYNWEKFKNKKVLIKGCSEAPIPTWSYLIITAHLVDYAKQILYGEPCSAIKIFERKK